MNAALGMKKVWRTIIGKESWWKKTLISKYMDGTRKRLLNGNIPIRQCTQIWKLVKKTIPLMSRYISKILGNGKTISIWEDRIMGKEPLQTHPEIEDIQEWMKDKGFNTLHSISLWNQKEWQDWKRLAISTDLEGKWSKIRQLLKGLMPIHFDEEDAYFWDLSGGHYTVRSRYKILQEQPNQQDWDSWKIAWKSGCLLRSKCSSGLF